MRFAMLLFCFASTMASDTSASNQDGAHKNDEQNLPYSKEAVAAGLEGTVEVLLLLDGTGKVLAARVEKSSGHALLDRDALRTARELVFPKDAPREILYPIRFRLRGPDEE